MALSPKGPQGEGSEYVLVEDVPQEDPALSHGTPYRPRSRLFLPRLSLRNPIPR